MSKEKKTGLAGVKESLSEIKDLKMELITIVIRLPMG